MTSFFRSMISTAAFASALLLGAVAQADDLATVTESGTLRVALTGAFPPFSFVDEQNTVVGFDVDIGTETAKRMGVKAEIVTTRGMASLPG